MTSFLQGIPRDAPALPSPCSHPLAGALVPRLLSRASSTQTHPPPTNGITQFVKQKWGAGETTCVELLGKPGGEGAARAGATPAGL